MKYRYFVSETGYVTVAGENPDEVIAALLSSGYREVSSDEFRRESRRLADQYRAQGLTVSRLVTRSEM